MTRVTLVCPVCGYMARRELSFEPGSRGVHETSSEPGRCPAGHGLLRRADGVEQERWALWSHTAGAYREPEVEISLAGCGAIGVGGYHSDHYADPDDGVCRWCGDTPPSRATPPRRS